MLHFGYLLLLPAALGIMHVGGALAAFGLASLPGLLVTDFYALALAQHLDRAQSVAISDATQESWWAR